MNRRIFCYSSYEFGICLCLMIFSIFTAVSRAANFTLEQVMSSPFPSGLVAALHADRVAWAFIGSGVRDVWVAVGPELTGRQVTDYGADDGEPVARVHISPE